MNFKQLISTIVLSAATISGLAHADSVYSNADDATSGIYYLAAPDSTSYGQLFTAPGGILKDFSFQAFSGDSGNVSLVIANWDGIKAVGPALYATSIRYDGGSQFLGATGINLALASGSDYIAYLTIAGVSGAVDNVTIAGSETDTGLGGGFRFFNSALADPLTMNESWSSWSTAHLAYTATFAPATAVPEPGTYAMFVVGIGMMGVVARRRKKQA